MQGLWQTFLKSLKGEWKFIANSRIDWLMLFLFPFLALCLVWSIFSEGQVHNLPIGVLDQNNTALSRKLIRFIDASPNVKVSQNYRSKLEMEQDLYQTKTYATLIIPKDFSRDIYQAKQSPVSLVVNAQYGTHSGIIQANLESVVKTFSAGIELNIRTKLGMGKKQAMDAIFPIKPEPKMAFNLSINYQQFLASTMIPAILHILATVVGVGILGRELRDKTIEKWFLTVSSGKEKSFLTFLSALIGKLFWYGVIFCSWITIALILINWHSLASISNFLITLLNAWLFMVLSLSIGIFLVLSTMSYRMGLSNAGIITAPAFAFSGITYPIIAMPKIAQIIAIMLPLTHYLKVQVAQLESQQSWYLGVSTALIFLGAILILIFLATLFGLIALKQKHKWGMR